jgi:hypothetical protein
MFLPLKNDNWITHGNALRLDWLSDQNKADLTRSAEDILLTRENYFPAAIANMYDPSRMDSEFSLVREAHDRNDEILECIYMSPLQK